MSTFVLVHGAWHGAWCWNRVRRALQAQGHEVFSPTLTGLAERCHLLSRETDLQTHIDDVMNLLQWEDLSDIVLCGHSYGGCVISGVADRAPGRIGALVYLDAFVLQDGQSLHDTLPPEAREGQLQGARELGEGWRVPPIPAEVFNVNAADRAWVDSQCTPQPLATFQQPLRLAGGLRTIGANSFIFASGWGPSPFTAFYEQAKGAGWRTSEVPCGHDVMLDDPAFLAAELLAVAPA
jgi:pimeloyl-ACP methyl ester carboxylesterase